MLTRLAWLVDLVAAILSFLHVWCSHDSQTCLRHMKSVCGTCQSRKIPWTAAILPTSKRRQPFRQRRTMRFASGDKNFLSKRDVQSVGFTLAKIDFG